MIRLLKSPNLKSYIGFFPMVIAPLGQFDHWLFHMLITRTIGKMIKYKPNQK